MEKNKNTYESYNETVEEFKNSFSYGSRNNLFFKYLGGKNISENEFTIFIEELLNVIIDDIDKDEFSELKKLIFNSQIKGYLPKSKNDKYTADWDRVFNPAKYTYEDSPWTKFNKPLKKS